MPRFTLIKHPDGQYDSKVEVSFECEMVDVAKAHFDDFLQGSGFSLPDDAPFEPKLGDDDFLAKEEDYMWDDAFYSKFMNQAAQPVPMDGILGNAGEDVIFLGDYRKEPFIPTFHD